ncbi:eukaryotic translation initiation factor 3 subunit L isoform X2 [Patella vulgata]|uniref:eukaryotic translation initiation factor 3 subunit L isoform X2 n=1 Tax=Patella vulgata TaxID=6465 RepID=UPI0021800430|nr:eukaryotic translation initiation factor 3 subunit L isoform X2 [Patella vulgata]
MWSDDVYEPDTYGTGYDYESHTGDPQQDLEYERQYHSSSFIVPEVIKNFLLKFQGHILDQNLYEIQDAYENGFTQLTESFFKTSPWPEADSIAPIIAKEDPIFMILYRELHFRHIYARVPSGPSLDQRFESYYNYCNLFNYILSSEGPVPLELPNQWLWDIIDEFIYQFQSFSIYRCKLGKKSESELEILKQNPKIWNVHSVLNVLHSLVEKSNINKQLEVYTSGGDPDSVAGEFGQQSLYKMLGYFSLVGLLRLHSLLGDYYQALKVLENIDFNKQNLYSRVPACQITTFYYVGFAYMMMRRYQDAIRTFSNILLYIQRTKNMFLSNKPQIYDQISKVNDKMYTLLSICLTLHPMRIDESVHSQLREKCADKMLRMQKGDINEFEQSFSFACPKFLSPVPPNYESLGANYHKEPFNLQLRVFLDEVGQQILVPTIRSYLKLYTTLPVYKLAAFMDVNEDVLKTQLMCFKHKMKNVVWTKGTSGLDGEFQSASEVDFYIDRDMIHVADTKVARRYGDFYIRQIHKFDEITRTLKMQ